MKSLLLVSALLFSSISAFAGTSSEDFIVAQLKDSFARGRTPTESDFKGLSYMSLAGKSYSTEAGSSEVSPVYFTLRSLPAPLKGYEAPSDSLFKYFILTADGLTATVRDSRVPKCVHRLVIRKSQDKNVPKNVYVFESSIQNVNGNRCIEGESSVVANGVASSYGLLTIVPVPVKRGWWETLE
ncbi:MAG: hypothetical protein J7501_11465 [Bdellovibrio sp.]|nr:hypothetical protein [Bdellovibrio sp.]